MQNCLRATKAERSCSCFQSIQRPVCDKDALEALYDKVWIKQAMIKLNLFKILLKVKEVRYSCNSNEVVGFFSDCNKALKLAAEEIGYCARVSVDGMRSPWDQPHDDADDVLELD